MIVSKTPLRVPFAGGLSDLKSYAGRFGGATLSSTIDKHVYVMLKENLGGYVRLRYQDVQEKVAALEHVKHPLIRESVRLVGLEGAALDLVVMADLAGESGLGTSGALTVGLLHALHAYKGEVVTAEQLLQEACHLEVEVLQGASGYHDPSICALGGLKLIEYRGNHITAREVRVDEAFRETFEASLLFFYGGRHHRSKPSLDLLTSRLEEAYEVLHAIKALAYELEEAFAASDLKRVAEIVGEKQALKQQLPGHFVDDYVLDVVRRVRETGAYAQLPGGKISAFVIVCCPDGQHEAVRRALADHKEVTLALSREGTQVTHI